MSGKGEWSVESLRKRLKAFAPRVSDAGPAAFLVTEGAVGERPFRLEVFLTERFLKRARKAKLLGSARVCKALANVRYGYDPRRGESPGGADGIFNVSAGHEPKNDMVRKLYDRFAFTEKGEALLEAYGLDARERRGVRVVSHHLRLLGFIRCAEAEEGPAGKLDGRLDRRPCGRLDEKLVLVDLDVNRR